MSGRVHIRREERRRSNEVAVDRGSPRPSAARPLKKDSERFLSSSFCSGVSFLFILIHQPWVVSPHCSCFFSARSEPLIAR
ncbi:hypothetical protein VZT92_003347 [Zoarces viviparus]|uniref:Uncharacterized protein n=1 Tax=Zoarces viviparus TaxID=48416 RepID=A0AAW1G2Y6_ZOAVI